MALSLKKISNLFYGLIITFLIIIAVMVTASALPIPGGFKLFTVQSGSMEPAIHTGSVVLVKPESVYAVQDIITFKNTEDRNNPSPKFTTTHRIVDIKPNEQGATSFQTKGDANDAPDSTLTDPGLIIGKVMFSVPLLGFPVSFAKTREGLIALIIIPATIIIYSEIVSIKNEVVKLVQKRKHEET